MTTVAELLAKSRAAHQRYRAAAGRTDKDGKMLTAPDYHATEVAIREALSFRQLAHGEDPEHTDLAWAEPKATHEDLIAFYERYLAQVDAEKAIKANA